MPDIVPSYSGDRTAFMRAITATSRGLHREGFLLRPIRRTSTEVCYGIVREERDEDRLDHDHEATVSWSAEQEIITGDHPIARRVDSSYASLKGRVVADDWSSSITSYLEAHDDARMRGDGRVYWVPPQRIDDIRRLGCFLSDVGIDLVMCELEPEAHAVVEDVARESLFDELDRLQEEAAAFDGKQKPGTYSRRLEEYQRLRERAILYRDALGVGAEAATQILTELEAKVSSMLDLRKQTTIHRDGSVTGPGVSSSPRPETTENATDPAFDPTEPIEDVAAMEGHPTRAPACIRFAGAEFTLHAEDENVLTYVSDEELAKKSRLFGGHGHRREVAAGRTSEAQCPELGANRSSSIPQHRGARGAHPGGRRTGAQGVGDRPGGVAPAAASPLANVLMAAAASTGAHCNTRWGAVRVEVSTSRLVASISAATSGGTMAS
jgi:hypothetical protein